MGVMGSLKDAGKMKKMADEAKKEQESLRATGRSKRGFVTLTLDGDKNIKKLDIVDNAMSVSGTELAKHIREAHRVASKEIDKQVKKQMKKSEMAGMLQKMMGQ